MGARRVVVVDDDRSVRDLIARYLTPPSFELYCFARASEALARLPEIEPDLIVSDIMMPDMDGRDFFRRLRADPALLVVPFIFLTGVRSPKEIAELRAAGADDYLVKPFPMGRLVEKIRSRLGLEPDEPLQGEAAGPPAAPVPGASRYDLRLPRGRFSIVGVGGRRVQVLTEVQPGPSYTVVTVVAQEGRGVCRIETTWRNPLLREADFTLAERQLNLEHERTLRSLPDLLAEGPPLREFWSPDPGTHSSVRRRDPPPGAASGRPT